MTFDVIEIGAESLHQIREPWESLTDRATEPLLFQSWHWCKAWLECHSDASRAELELKLFVAKTEGGDWVGLAPLFIRPVKRIGITLRCLQFVGGASGMRTVFRTEYNDFLLDEAHATAARAALCDAIVRCHDWDEWSLSDIPVCETLDAVSTRLRGKGRMTADELGYRADLSDGFDAYISQLRGSARRQLFNKRKRLATIGAVRVSHVCTEQWPDFLEAMNDFHTKRWGQPVIGPLRSRFLNLLLNEDGENAPKQASSLLMVDETPYSALLDIDYRGRRYNLQAGINDCASSAISPGLLHFGFSMEDAADRQLSAYEFLIGRGKHENYKQSIATQEIRALSLNFPRPLWLRTLYAANDRINQILGR
ncbi:MAG: GNAT family N-acetyltransferase [Pseudomonadota bacterium]